MSLNKKINKLITDPNFNCNDFNSINKKVAIYENDLYVLLTDDKKCYDIIRLSKHRINVIQKYLYNNGLISEMKLKYLNTLSYNEKVDFLIKCIREYELWLLSQDKEDTKTGKLFSSIRLILICEKVKLNKYSDKIDLNKKYIKKDYKIYSLLEKKRRRLERKIK